MTIRSAFCAKDNCRQCRGLAPPGPVFTIMLIAVVLQSDKQESNDGFHRVRPGRHLVEVASPQRLPLLAGESKRSRLVL